MGLVLWGMLLSKINKFSRQFLSIKCLLLEKKYFLGNFLREMYKLKQKKLENKENTGLSITTCTIFP